MIFSPFLYFFLVNTFMKKVKKLDYGSFAITVALANTILSLIFLILFLPLLLIMPMWPMWSMWPFRFVVAPIALQFIVIPVISFLSGLISGFLIALIYNLFLHKYVKIEVE